MSTVKRIALTLVIIGAINWGLIGLFQFDLVATLFAGQDSLISRIVYTLVGLSGLISLAILFAPMEEESTRMDRGAINTANLNYGTTEFGEETNFSNGELQNEENRGNKMP